MTPGGFDIRRFMFRIRSYTPVPFLVLMLFFARPTLWSLVCGGLMVAAGEALRFWGVSIAGSETRTTGTVGGSYLITNGPFAYVRNPLYVGNMTLYTGIGIMSLALFPWLAVAALLWFALQYHLIVTAEEEYLANRFGSPYAEYCREVPRFLPRLTPFRSSAPPVKGVSFAEGLASERRTLQAIGLVTMTLVAMALFQQP